MKKVLLLSLIFALLVPIAASASAVFQPIDIAAPGTYHADLNGDGLDEEIVLIEDLDEYGDPATTLIVNGDEHPGLFTYDRTAFIVDLDPADAFKEILLCGDMMSNDYVTECLRFGGDALVNLSVLDELAEEPEFELFYGQLTLDTTGALSGIQRIDLLGTWYWSRPYQLAADGAHIQPVPDTLWDIVLAPDPADPFDDLSCLTTLKPLPVTLTENGVDSAAELPVGTKLLPRLTDGVGLFGFTTQSGQVGFFPITPASEGWGHDIHGAFQDEWFAYIPYAD